MSPRAVIVLAAATALALIGAIAAIVAQPRPAAVVAERAYVFDGLAEGIADVTTIDIAYGGGSFMMVRDSQGAWSLATKDGFPAKAYRVRELLVGLGDLRFREPKTRRAERHTRLQVEDIESEGASSGQVTLRDGAAQMIAALIVGRPRSYVFGTKDQGTYIRLPGDPQAWLATGRLNAGASFTDWVDRNIIDLDMSAIRSVSVRQPNGGELAVVRDHGEEDYMVVGDPALPAGQQLDQSEVNFLSTGLAYLDLEDVAVAAGFSFPESFHTAEAVMFDGRQVIAEIADLEGAPWVRLRALAPAEGDGSWAEAFNERVGPWVYRVPEFKAKKLRSTLTDLLEPVDGGAP